MNGLYCIEDAKGNNNEEKSFNIKLSASMEDVKEGEALNLTCETPPGKDFHQQWLHPQNQARPSSVFCFALSLSVLCLTNIIKFI